MEDRGAERRPGAIKADHNISGTFRRANGVHVRVVAAAAPNAGVRALAPNLEDAYRYGMARRARSRATVVEVLA